MESAETKPPSTTGISGKLVIIGIVAIAFWAAAISWYFRYNATHRAAKFWGAEVATLIRDAPQVTLRVMPTNSGAAQASPVQSDIDVSQAQGLTHFRNALLEDHNFVWPEPNARPKAGEDFGNWKWILEFRDPQSGKFGGVSLLQDCTRAARYEFSERPEAESPTTPPTIPTSPTMAKGLRQMIAEFTATDPASGEPESQATDKAAEPAR